MAEQKRCTTEILDGKLIGVQEKLPNGNFMDVYRGIPYAEPPIGDLRFRKPVPLGSLPAAELDCSKDRDANLQYDFTEKLYYGSENCLFLNVFKPSLTNRNEKLPVMLFIPGGGFNSGSSDTEFYSPDYLVQENVVVVSCNYRIGAFGFLYLPEAGVNGNFGLYDQVAVLRWIQNFISSFNGDPNNVTIFGQSAGAASVHIHYLSPLSRKYFHKVISQSGTLLNDWVTDNLQAKKSRKIAELAGCQSTDDIEIFRFLKNMDAQEFLEKSLLVREQDEITRSLPFPFRPVIEKNRKYTVLPKYPSEYDTGKLDEYDIPIILGYNDRESIAALPFKKNPLDLKENIPLQLNLKIDDADEVNPLVNEIKHFYFGDKEVDMDGVLDYICDVISNTGFHMDLEHLKRFQSKIYVYKFSFDGEMNCIKQENNYEQYKGAAHGDELLYLFKYGDKYDHVAETSSSYKMRTLMVKLWTNFAKYGNPTPDSTTPKWEMIDNNCLETENRIFHFSDDSKMILDPDSDRYQFWKSIYRRINGTDIEPKFL